MIREKYGICNIMRMINHQLQVMIDELKINAVSEFLERLLKDDYGSFGIIKVEILQND